MPIGKQWGYLFGDVTTRTLAHELGHGKLSLTHTFAQYLKEGATSNLMDYPSTSSGTIGTELVARQWQSMHDLAMIDPFQNDGDGAAHSARLLEVLNAIRTSLKTNTSVDINMYINSIYTASSILISAEIKSVAIKAINSVAKIKIALNDVNKTDHPVGNQTYWDIAIGESLLISLSSESDRDLLYNWLTNQGNTILFVNGYRANISLHLNENDDSNDKINTSDIFEYWEGVDQLFKNRRKSTLSFYADGHRSITSSNHRTMAAFIESLAGYFNTTVPPIGQNENDYGIPSEYNADCFHNNACIHLNTTPNTEGFNLRMVHGRIAGAAFVSQLKKTNFKIETDELDIVCHSMGFAYAQGMIEVIKEQMPNIKLGGYYIIAPENAKTGSVNVSEWKEIWQYGSDESKTDKMWLQDGIAPQTPVGDIGTRRAYNTDEDVPKGFISSHRIKYYPWIFDKLTNDKGYVTSR